VQERALGSQGLMVSALGLGCMGMTAAYGPGASQDESVATIRRAVELGVTMLDTADVYGGGDNEELVGRATRLLGRDEVVIATKFGNIRDQFGSRVDGRPAYVAAACEGSLRRLGLDHIDLYYQHRVDRTVPIEETWGAMAELVSRGLVKYLGISEAAPATIRRAHQVHPITAGQYEFSLFTRDYEDDVFPVLRELGIGIVAFSPLGRGFATGSIEAGTTFGSDDFRSRMPRFQEKHLEHNAGVAESLRRISEAKGISSAQAALAWLLSRGSDVVPIPGSKSRDHLEENCSASGIELEASDLARISAQFPAGAMSGARYDSAGSRTINL
jgi:aryl-alcohol dehydrogenase-like predicted oxidoreductase